MEKTKSDIANEAGIKFARSAKAKRHQKSHHEKVVERIKKTEHKMKHSKEDLNNAHQHMKKHMH